MKTIAKLLTLVILVIVLLGFGGMTYLSNGLKDGKSITVNTVDLSSLNDGEYLGTYENKRWDNQVKIQIESGTITDIEVVDTVMFEKPEVTEALINQVLDKQSLVIDGVTGSTVSVNAYLKAIEDALMKARQ